MDRCIGYIKESTEKGFLYDIEFVALSGCGFKYVVDVTHMSKVGWTSYRIAKALGLPGDTRFWGYNTIPKSIKYKPMIGGELL